MKRQWSIIGGPPAIESANVAVDDSRKTDDPNLAEKRLQSCRSRLTRLKTRRRKHCAAMAIACDKPEACMAPRIAVSVAKHFVLSYHIYRDPFGALIMIPPTWRETDFKASKSHCDLSKYCRC